MKKKTVHNINQTLVDKFFLVSEDISSLCLIYSQYNPEIMEWLNIGKNCALLELNKQFLIYFYTIAFPHEL